MSENHIRGISTTLALLDKALCEFDDWAKGHEIRSVLYQVLNPLSEAQRQIIAIEVSEMKSLLQEMQNTLHLEVTMRSVDKMIVSSSAVLWTSLSELEDGRLSRYGSVPRGLEEYLNSRITALNVGLRRISATVAAPQPP